MARYDSGVRYDTGVRYDSVTPVPNPNKTMSQNLISETMTDVQRDALIGFLSAFEIDFADFVCLLTPAQIRHLAKLDQSDLALLEVAMSYATQNPGAVPSDVNVAELAKDIALARQLAPIVAKTERVFDLVRCSLIATLSDGFAVARQLYRLERAKGHTPANSAFLDAFGAHFGRGPRDSQPEPSPEPPVT